MTARAFTGWVVDECPDALGFFTVRPADGTPNGNTDVEPVATVYTQEHADLIASAPRLAAEHAELRAALQHLTDTIVLVSGGADRTLIEGASYGSARALLARIGGAR